MNRYDRVLQVVDEAIDLPQFSRRKSALEAIKVSRDWKLLPIYLKGKVDAWIEIRMRNRDRVEGTASGARLP